MDSYPEDTTIEDFDGIEHPDDDFMDFIGDDYNELAENDLPED